MGKPSVCSSSESPTGAVSSLPPVTVRERIGDQQSHLLDPLHHELGDPIASLDDERLGGILSLIHISEPTRPY